MLLNEFGKEHRACAGTNRASIQALKMELREQRNLILQVSAKVEATKLPKLATNILDRAYPTESILVCFVALRNASRRFALEHVLKRSIEICIERVNSIRICRKVAPMFHTSIA